jgi:hypothetical protein
MISVYQHTGHWASCCQWPVCISTHVLLSCGSNTLNWCTPVIKEVALNDQCVEIHRLLREALLIIGVYQHTGHWPSCCQWPVYCINTDVCWAATLLWPIIKRVVVDDRVARELLLMTGWDRMGWSVHVVYTAGGLWLNSWYRMTRLGLLCSKPLEAWQSWAYQGSVSFANFSNP